MDKIFEKVTSARFWMAVIFTLTFCQGFLKGLIPAEAFVPMVALSVNWYFDRKDRKMDGQ